MRPTAANGLIVAHVDVFANLHRALVVYASMSKTASRHQDCAARDGSRLRTIKRRRWLYLSPDVGHVGAYDGCRGTPTGSRSTSEACA
jgi:hypothetical protein